MYFFVYIIGFICNSSISPHVSPFFTFLLFKRHWVLIRVFNVFRATPFLENISTYIGIPTGNWTINYLHNKSNKNCVIFLLIYGILTQIYAKFVNCYDYISLSVEYQCPWASEEKGGVGRAHPESFTNAKFPLENKKNDFYTKVSVRN